MTLSDSCNNFIALQNSIILENSIIFHQITDVDFINNSKILHKIILQENAQYSLGIMLCLVKEATLEIEIEALGDNASFEIIFLYALSEDQKITIITKQMHRGKRTKSALYARGIVKDSAILNHQGLIAIQESGHAAESSLEHKALVFGMNAHVVLVPSIEVLNNDVQCFHGAAVGQFQEEHVWYLKSRGFDEKQVYRMLLKSFFSEYMERFDQPEKILESLCQKIV